MDGILNIYKESGYTSHDVVGRLRGILKTKKIGHTGTLDPNAQGVLPVCVGKATRVCEFFSGDDKEYEAVCLLGVTTDTQDMEGRVLEKREVSCSEKEVRECIESFCGDIEQVPPMYSAIKVQGKKLYELARKGIEVERRPRKVCIKEIEVLEITLPRVRFRVACSKGTYIRTLCDDIGKKLGCGAAMESLLRTGAGRFSIGQAVTLAQVEEAVQKDLLSEILMPADVCFSHFWRIRTKAEADKALHNGNKIPRRLVLETEVPADQSLCRIYDSFDEFCGFYRFDGNTEMFLPKKVMV